MSEKKVWGNENKPRAMDNAEVRALRKSGLHPHYVDNPGKMVEDLVDWVLDNVYAEYNFKGVSQADCIDITTKTVQLTYGSVEETKNS